MLVLIQRKTNLHHDAFLSGHHVEELVQVLKGRYILVQILPDERMLPVLPE